MQTSPSFQPARLLLERERRRRRKIRKPLMQFIPSTTRGFEAPEHLQPLVDLFERVGAGEEVRAIVSTPPQHGKSETSLHGLCWLLGRNPRKRHAYATYAQQFARDQNDKARVIAEKTGVRLARTSADRWTLEEGGKVAWTGVGGPLTGHAIDGLLLCDDLLKNRQEAESGTVRDQIMGWLYGVAIPRVHPGGSIILIATRWHPNDPSGQLIRQGWESINLPAVSEDGRALWPSARPLGWLEQRRKELTEYDWWSLYQGEPRPRGGAVFQGTHYYDKLPDGGYQEAHGFDAAYTAKTHADYSVTITGRRYTHQPDSIYVTNLIREQLEPRHYIARVKAEGIREVHWRLSGTEKGLQSLLIDHGINVIPYSASTDKFVNAQPLAVDWNAGRILLPKNQEWADPIEDEVLAFTGLNDPQDDIVDALAALHRALLKPNIADEDIARGIYGW